MRTILVWLLSSAAFASAGAQQSSVEISAGRWGVSGGEAWTAQDVVGRLHRDRSTLYLFANRSARPEGDGTYGAIGVTRDWTQRFFSYTAIGGAVGDAPYLPRFRADADLNWKMLRSRRLVATAGVTTLRYSGDRSDDVVSVGATYYAPLITTYRFFVNSSDPGSLRSNAHLIQIAYERPDTRSAWFRHSWGSEAWLATAVITPEAVRTRGQTTTVAYRQWMSRRLGVLAEIERQTKRGGFSRSGGRLGVQIRF